MATLTGASERPARRQRQLALAVLLSAVTVAAVTLPVRATWWGGWILAIAEAGIVGGLADWFAVTAIFRRPLGLPIPHTALIATNWELMAARVGTMVGSRILTESYVKEEIDRLDLAERLRRLAEQLGREELRTATRFVARWVADQLSPQVTEDLVERLRRLASGWPLAPILATALEVGRQHRWDERAVAALTRAMAEAFDRPGVRVLAGNIVDDALARYRESLGTYPRLFVGLAAILGVIDRDKIVQALHAGLSEVANDPAHPLRQRISEALARLPARLREDSALAEQLEAVKRELLGSAAVGQLLADAAAELRRSLVDDLGSDASELVHFIAGRLELARLALIADQELRRDLESWIKRQALTLVDRYHGQIAAFVEKGVRTLGPEGAVRLIEEHAGDDLQYIRVNGTVVGGLAGGAIYGLHLLLRLI